MNAVLFLLALGGPAWGQQPAARKRALPKRVRKLGEKVDQLEALPNQIDLAKPAGSTAARVAKVETSLVQIRSERPPSADTADGEKINRWIAEGLTLKPVWKDGLHFESSDGSIKFKIGGRIQFDYGYFAKDADHERRLGDSFEDGTESRRKRIYISGTIDKDFEFKVDYNFVHGDASFKDVYLGLKNHETLGNVRFGHFKEPFSIEELASSNNITFLERSLVNSFSPSRSTGVMFYDTMTDKRGTWAAGFFRRTDYFGDGPVARDYSATARVTALPIYEDKGKKLLHVGLSYTHQSYEDDEARFQSRPEAHMTPKLVDTGTFAAEYGDLIGGEIAWVDGPFSLEAEYVHAFIKGRDPGVGDPRFWAASLQASYFLTGEHRPYKTSAGAFGRIIPLENYSMEGGKGAWELAARISFINLNDSNIDGGRLRDFTLGLNWYLNPNVRTMWNYVLADPSEGGTLSAFLWRLQVAF